MASSSFTSLQAYKQLEQLHEATKSMNLRTEFEKDSTRFDEYSLLFKSINNEDNLDVEVLFDYSKNLVNKQVIETFSQLFDQINLKDKIKQMFYGQKINVTEDRSVLHVALRNISQNPENVFDIKIDNKDIMSDIKSELDKVQLIANKINNKEWLGYTDKPIASVVNIGIGGSDLGPKMVVEALNSYKINDQIVMYFVSNVDGNQLINLLNKLDQQTTLFIISSKTFTTQETLTNANTAKKWFLEKASNESFVSKHFVGISTNFEGCIKFGINKNNILTFWDYVGGRYSLWSSIGLSIAISIGYENYIRLLKGAHLVDMQFLNIDRYEENIPAIMAMLGIWYNNIYKCETQCILPYYQNLQYLANYLQQLDMESNGKYITKNNEETNYQTGPIVWGEPGTNGQHAFYQLIHQGTKMIPCDFIGVVNNNNTKNNEQLRSRSNIHHKILLSNFVAQTQALMRGKTEQEVIRQIEKIDNEEQKQKEHKIRRHMEFKGNKPTNSILVNKLNPETLGALIAFYEHKVFVMGAVYNINSFDQFGVELGKVLAKEVLSDIQDNKTSESKRHDSSTNGLINFINNKFTD